MIYQTLTLTNFQISWSAIIIFTTANVIVNIINADLDKYLRNYWFGLRVAQCGQTISIMMGSIETLIYYLSTFTPMSFCALYYALLCSLITRLFQEFNNWVSMQTYLTGDKTRRVRQMHNQLCELARQMDDVLSPIAFFLYLMIVLDLSKYVYYLISSHSMRFKNVMQSIFILTRVMHMLWLFFTISLSAANISEVSHYSLGHVQHLTTISNDVRTYDSQLHYQSLLLVAQLNASPIMFTGWKTFHISRQFIITILGAVITYSIILFQMTPWVVNT